MRLLLVSGHKRFDKYKPAVRKAVGFLAKETKRKNYFVEVFLVGKEFMNKNVLAFPAPKKFPNPTTKLKPLGEIYLNPDYIKNEEPYADISNWASAAEAKLMFMLIHGFLHLAGYDHKKNNDRIKMEKRERQLLNKLSGL